MIVAVNDFWETHFKPRAATEGRPYSTFRGASLIYL